MTFFNFVDKIIKFNKNRTTRFPDDFFPCMCPLFTFSRNIVHLLNDFFAKLYNFRRRRAVLEIKDKPLHICLYSVLISY